MKRKFAALLALCLTLGCLTACGGEGSGSGADASSVSSGAVSSSVSTGETADVIPPIPVGEPILPEEVPQNFAFSDDSGMWVNFLALNRDGSFASSYTDVVANESGEGHPNGTIYYCDHEDRFLDIQQVNDYTWTMTLNVEEGEREFGEAWIEDGIRYVFTEPFGLTGGDAFVLYGPETPLAELDEEFLQWLPSGYLGENQTTLGCYGICNVVWGYGFFSVDEG